MWYLRMVVLIVIEAFTQITATKAHNVRYGNSNCSRGVCDAKRVVGVEWACRRWFSSNREPRPEFTDDSISATSLEAFATERANVN